LCGASHTLAEAARARYFSAVSEERNDDNMARDRAATRRDVDAGVRDRLAGEDMPDDERDARAHAARDRMAAMHDRQAAARVRGDVDGDGEHRRPPETTDGA